MRLDHEICYRAITARDARFDGRLFVAVKTTGVYCRPICPARTPRRENVSFYRSAAAAQEAGFRPCLRCRPEAAPELSVWRGTSNTVSRALALIEGGALDQASVAELADRLGVGERQLRRLFDQHLGASPVAVAQTRRLLLAKQLLHETRLSMSEIALASGYGSIRRFNEAFRALFQRPPSALRRGRAEPVERAGGEVELSLRYRPPYAWEPLQQFLRERAIPGVEQVLPDVYARTIAIGDERGTLRVRLTSEHALRATIEGVSLRALPVVIARIRQLFDLTADPEAIGAQLAADPTLAPLVAARPGMRVPGAWDGFELAIRAVLGQQISVAGATALAGKLVAAYGEPLASPARPGLTHLFPRPARLAEADLTQLGMPRARAEALSGLARAVLRDPQLLARRASLEDAVAALTTLPGIGPWTAQYIAMRELREPDAFPAADLGLMRALARDGRRPSPAELARRAEGWRPFRAYAAQHLWASLRDVERAPAPKPRRES